MADSHESDPGRYSGTASKLSPRELRIETLELRVALGGRSSEAARIELEALLNDPEGRYDEPYTGALPEDQG